MRFFILFLFCLSSSALAQTASPCRKEFSSPLVENGLAEKAPPALNAVPLSPQIRIEKFKTFLEERFEESQVKDILSRTAKLKYANFETVKKNVLFLESYIGPELVNEKLSRSIIGFIKGNGAQLEETVEWLERYVEQNGVLFLMRKSNAYFSFFDIKLEHHRRILELLEPYFGTAKIRKLILKDSKKFFALRLKPFEDNIHFLQTLLTPRKIAETLRNKENFYSLFNFNSANIKELKNLLEPLLGEKEFLSLLQEDLAVLADTHPAAVSSNIHILKRMNFTVSEIKTLLLEKPRSFLNIIPYDLKHIAQAVTQYFGKEGASSLFKMHFHQIAGARWQKVRLSHIKDFTDKLPPAPELISLHFKSQSGQVRFADQFFSGSMDKAYRFAKHSLSPARFTELEWKEFKGTTKLFVQMKNRLFDPNDKMKPSYRGIEGQKKAARIHFRSSMIQAFLFALKVIDSSRLNSLGWKPFRGTAEDFENLPSLLFDKKGRFKYMGLSGMFQLADILYQGDAQKTYTNVSAVVEKPQFEKLGWKLFLGKHQDYKDIRQNLVQPDGSIFPQYIGLAGQSLYAKTYTNHALFKAYSQVQLVLEPEIFSQLGWKSIAIRSADLENLYQNVFDQEGNLTPEYLTESGYMDIADEFFQGLMRKAYEVIETLMDRKKFLKLGWKKFYGRTYEYRNFINEILDEMGRINPSYIGTKGHALFAARHTKGRMKNAYHNVSIVLPRRLFQQLNWQYFRGTVKEAQNILNKLMDAQGQIRRKYRFLEGYKKFSDEFFKGSMNKCFNYTFALLNSKQKQELGWHIFRGSTAELKALFNDFKKNYPDRWRGQENLKRLAGAIFPGKSLAFVFQNVQAVKDGLFLSEKESSLELFKQLNWQRKSHWDILREQFQFEAPPDQLMEMKRIFEFLTAYTDGARMPIKYKRGFSKLSNPNLEGVILIIKTLEHYAGKTTAVKHIKDNLENILTLNAEEWIKMILFLENAAGAERLSDKLKRPYGKTFFSHHPSFLKRNMEIISQYTGEAFALERVNAFDAVLFKADPSQLALNTAFIAERIGHELTAQKIKQNLRGVSMLNNQKLLNLEKEHSRQWMKESLLNLSLLHPVFHE